MNKAKPAAVLLVAAFLIASVSLTGGCGRQAAGGKDQGKTPGGNDQGQAQQTGEDNELWKPFALQPGDYFKYTMIDHVQGGKQGWLTVQVKENEEGELEARWDGELDGKEFSVTTAAPADRLIELSRPGLITKPGAIPFLASVLASWWERVEGFKWQVGADWSVVLDEMMPAGFTVKVEDRCAVAGQEGFRSRFVSGETVMMEACVSPRLPLALSAKVNDVDNQPTYEALLVEYRPEK